jgi:hypothetical protein
MTRVMGVAGLLFGGAAALAACGSSPSPAALSPCGAAQLSASPSHRPDAGLGHAGITILLHNTGSSTCTLRGYATVTLVNESVTASHVASVTARKTPSGYLGGLAPGTTTPPLVTLKSGEVASFLVEGTDVPEGTAASCITFKELRITAPLRTSLGAQLPGCSPPQVHPFVPGVTGHQSS